MAKAFVIIITNASAIPGVNIDSGFRKSSIALPEGSRIDPTKALVGISASQLAISMLTNSDSSSLGYGLECAILVIAKLGILSHARDYDLAAPLIERLHGLIAVLTSLRA
jgi:hypothetical protein